MEGNVTISLSDYEILKKCLEEKEHYINVACRHINLLEKIEEELKADHKGLSLKTITCIENALEEWYG